MKLGDIFHSAAFKHRNDRDLALGGGSSAEVFEVTDLTIPAGTNWSNGGNPLGTFSISPYQFVMAKFFIELAPGHVDNLSLVADDFGAWGPNTASIYLTTPGLGGGLATSGLRAGTIGDIAWGSSVDTTDVDGLNAIDIVPGFARGFDPTPLADPFTFHVYLRTPSGATTEDMTVVRARAAFLVL